MMVTKLSIAIDLSRSHCHLFLGLIVSAFVVFLLSLHMAFTVLHMMFISLLVPVKTVFKASDFITIFKQFYSQSSLAKERDHPFLKLNAGIYIFVYLIHSRTVDLASQKTSMNMLRWRS